MEVGGRFVLNQHKKGWSRGKRGGLPKELSKGCFCTVKGLGKKKPTVCKKK